MRVLLCIPLTIAAASHLSPRCAWAASVRDGYVAPTYVVPRARAQPTIDGVVGDEEWQDAVSLTALQTTRRAVSPRQTRFWLSWDEDHLYLAMRSPLRPGERLVRALRSREREVNVVFDDSYEIWLDAGSQTPDGQPAVFQFLCNFDGARTDVLFEPAVGNSRPGWTSGWEPVSRLTAGGDAWEWELAIPRSSLFADEPFADGRGLRILLARNYKRPWEQNSVEGTSAFSVRDTYSHVTLSAAAPALHLLAVADPPAGTLGLNLEVRGRVEEELRWEFRSDGGTQREGLLHVRPGGAAAAVPVDPDRPGEGSYRITVRSAATGAVYLDWCADRAFGDLSVLTQEMNDTGDQASLSLLLNPVRDHLRVTGDLINYDERGRIVRFAAAVKDSRGKTLAEQDLVLDELAYVRGVLRLPGLAPGDYAASLVGHGRDGRALIRQESKFTKRDHPREFPWWDTKLGDIERVIDPWTPVRSSGRRIEVWGRAMTVGPAGLPAQVISQDRPLLAGPTALIAALPDGSSVRAEGVRAEVISQADHRAVIRAVSRLNQVRVTSRVTVEFDGMYRVEMELAPRRPVSLASLRLVVPLANEVADYFHAAGEGIRYGFDYGLLPGDGDGRLWDSTAVDGQPMVVGSFIPYIWVGNHERGLCWFADSDQGWVPDSETPAIELRRDSPASTDLVLNLISSEFRLDEPRTVTFAFQASPAKPMHRGWRMDSWWCGDTFRDYQGVDGRGGSLIWTNIPFTLDADTCRDMVRAQHESSNRFIFGVDKYRANAVPYAENNHIAAQFAPEVDYFNEEWETTISGGLCFTDTLTNYLIYHLGTWAAECGIDGYYVDNIRPQACDNIEAGRGYRLPDGRVQPTYQMFGTREYVLRMRAAFAEQGKHHKIVLHTTHNLVLPWIGAADIAYDGEHNVIYPEMGKSFMDLWTLERLRLDYPGQWGTVVNFMHEYQGPWERDALKQAMRAYTGLVLLHDALPSGNANGMNQEAWIARDRFGIEADDVRFRPYWEPDNGLRTETPNVYLAGWTRPGRQAGSSRLLLLAVNTGDATEATITLDPAKLGLPGPPDWTVTDAETGDAMSPGQAAELILPLPRHDYRQVIIESSG